MVIFSQFSRTLTNGAVHIKAFITAFSLMLSADLSALEYEFNYRVSNVAISPQIQGGFDTGIPSDSVLDMLGTSISLKFEIGDTRGDTSACPAGAQCGYDLLGFSVEGLGFSLSLPQFRNENDEFFIDYPVLTAGQAFLLPEGLTSIGVSTIQHGQPGLSLEIFKRDGAPPLAHEFIIGNELSRYFPAQTVDKIPVSESWDHIDDNSFFRFFIPLTESELLDFASETVADPFPDYIASALSNAQPDDGLITGTLYSRNVTNSGFRGSNNFSIQLAGIATASAYLGGNASFSDPDAWDTTSAPGSEQAGVDSALFIEPGTYTLSGAPTNALAALEVDNPAGVVTFEPGNGAAIGTELLTIFSEVVVKNGGIDHTGSLIIKPDGKLTIGENGFMLSIANDGNAQKIVEGSFRAEAGADIEIDRIDIKGLEMSLPRFDNDLDIGGENTVFYVSDSLKIGTTDDFVALAQVSNNAVLGVDGELRLATSPLASTGLTLLNGAEVRSATSDEGVPTVVVGDEGDASVTLLENSRLLIGDRLVVGNGGVASGSLDVTNGSSVGGGTTVESFRADVVIGSFGEGIVRITDSGEFFANGRPGNELIIGERDVGVGQLDINTASQLPTFFFDVTVGEQGEGQLNLADGARFETNFLTIADQDDSLGEVTLSGGTTTLTMRNEARTIIVGSDGMGTLNISDGARVGQGADPGGLGLTVAVGAGGKEEVIAAAALTGNFLPISTGVTAASAIESRPSSGVLSVSSFATLFGADESRVLVGSGATGAQGTMFVTSNGEVLVDSLYVGCGKRGAKRDQYFYPGRSEYRHHGLYLGCRRRCAQHRYNGDHG